jgi:hypothetical protein
MAMKIAYCSTFDTSWTTSNSRTTRVVGLVVGGKERLGMVSPLVAANIDDYYFKAG